MTDDVLEQTAELAAMLRDPSADESTHEHALRLHHLKQMARSPLHARHAVLCDDEPNLAKRIGSGVHSLLLGGDPLVCYPGKVRNGKVWEAFAAEHTGSLIYLKNDYDRSHRIADAVRKDKLAHSVLYPGGVAQYEQTVWFEQLGRKRRSTPDVRSISHLAELKSTRNAEPEKFQYDARRMGYHCQLADQANAIFEETGKFPDAVFIVAVEQLAPFGVSVHQLSKSTLELGERQVRAWLERFIVHEQSNVWPGYSQSFVPFDIQDTGEGLVFDDAEAA